MELYERLECDWAEANELDRAGMVACASGTAALHLAMELVRHRFGQGPVVVPDFTMIACARACTLAGVRPHFVDCNRRLLIDPELIRDRQSMTAIMPVHIYGRRCDMGTIAAIACRNNCVVIEDMAEIHGVPPRTDSFAACWSFYKNKIVAGEEGGAVWFGDHRDAKVARSLRSLGLTESHDFTHIARGHNYRLSNAHAAMILESLKNFKLNRKKRREVEGWYYERIPPEWRMPSRDEVWVYDLRLPDVDKDLLIPKLNARGVRARHAFKPMNSQHEYTPGSHYASNALAASREVMYLPVHPSMAEQDVATTVETLFSCID